MAGGGGLLRLRGKPQFLQAGLLVVPVSTGHPTGIIGKDFTTLCLLHGHHPVKLPNPSAQSRVSPPPHTVISGTVATLKLSLA